MRIHTLSYSLVVLLGCQVPDVQAQGNMEIEVAFPSLQFTRPVDLQHAGDGTGRLFVVEQRGVITIFDKNDVTPVETTFLDIENRVRDQGNEEGLLGLAFHPDYASNGYFYVYHSASSPRRSVLARYTVLESDPDRADSESEKILLTVDQPAGNHNGGQIAFGPDGYLYIGLGDGGGANDPYENGQDLTTLLGSILRIDVDDSSEDMEYGIPDDNPYVDNTSDYKEEIFAHGLRNPWRFSFDSETGTLYAADVGQNAYEEIDVIENGNNYGWNTMEGDHCFSPSHGCDREGLTVPIAEYAHGGSPKSVTGGFVYRGPTMPELVGKYVYADYVNGRIWALEYDGEEATDPELLVNTSLSISSFGVDEDGELYILAFDGKIHRFAPTNTGTVESDLPDEASGLLFNHPNPFRKSTTIRYALREATAVDLGVFTVHGRRVRTLVNGRVGHGEHESVWDGVGDDGQPLAAGVYILRLAYGGNVADSRKIVLAR